MAKEIQTEIQLATWKVTINYIAARGAIRSTSLALEAPDVETAKKNALLIAQENGWKKPRVTNAKSY